MLAASTSRSVLNGEDATKNNFPSIPIFPFSLSLSLPDDTHAPLVTPVSLAASTTIASSPSELIESVGKKVADVDRVSFPFSQAISTP